MYTLNGWHFLESMSSTEYRFVERESSTEWHVVERKSYTEWYIVGINWLHVGRNLLSCLGPLVYF
jgi:hypothetical protein